MQNTTTEDKSKERKQGNIKDDSGTPGRAIAKK
jgi:hypothetical protein